jgi:hypothetical protein
MYLKEKGRPDFEAGWATTGMGFTSSLASKKKNKKKTKKNIYFLPCLVAG